MKYPIDKNRIEYRYAEKILNGTYKSCWQEKKACERFMRDLERQNDDDFPWCFDASRADRFFRFFEQCANIDAPINTFLKLAEFQYFDFANIFGFVDKVTGRRRFNEALIFEARGQGKSSACAVISLYALTADAIYPPYHPELRHFELNPSIVTFAVDREQTKQVRGTAMEMARRSPSIREQINVKNTYIKSKKRGGEIAAISKEIGNLDGAKLNLAIADEWAAMHEDTRINVLRGSFGKREQSMLVKITTAGDDAMHKPAKVDYDRCLEVLNGRIVDDTYFIVIRELEEKDDPADFSIYEKCTPMLREHNDYSERLLKQIKDEYNKAFPAGTEQQKIEYLIKRTNRWQVGSELKFLNQDQLDMLQKSIMPKEEFLQLIKDCPCVCGIDASKVIDLTAESFIFKLSDDKIGIYAHGFMPKETVYTHLKTDKLPYESYEKKGYLSFIDGTYIDNFDLKQYLYEFERDNNLEIKAVCADNAYCQQLLIDLTAGRTPNNKIYDVIECPQTTSVLNEPCINFLTWLTAGKLVICENDLFMQHCANAYVQYDKGGRMKVAKKNDSSAFRIDLLAAALNAIRRIDLLNDQTLLNLIASGEYHF